MSESILIHCEHCGAGLRLAAGKIRPGSTAPCPRCRRPIVLATPAAAPTADSEAVDEIQCQVCGAMLRIRADHRPASGMTARCPRCQSKVYIPPVITARPSTLAPPPPEEAPAPRDPPASSPATAASFRSVPAFSPAPPRRPAPLPPAPPSPLSLFQTPARVSASGTATIPAGPEVDPDDLSSPAPYPNPFRLKSSSLEEESALGMEAETPRTAVAQESPPRETAFEPPAPTAPEVVEPDTGGQEAEPPEVEEPDAGEPEVEVPVAGDEAEEPAIELQGDEEALPAAHPSATPSTGLPAAATPSRRAEPGVFWTVEIGGETLHPGGVAELRLWARQGKLKVDDRVRRGEGAWQVAREVPELTSLFARSRPAGARPAAAARRQTSPETRRGWVAGALGGIWALPPIFALLIFSGEFERLAAAWKSNNTTSFLLLSLGVMLSGAALGRALAELQSRYEQRGEAANMWSAGGAMAVGGGAGIASGAAGLAFWPYSSFTTLLCGFALYGVTLGLLVLLSYRWLFVDRHT